MKNKKYLIVGSGNYEIYEKALYNAFIDLGYNAEAFFFKKFFEQKPSQNIRNMIKRLEGKTTIQLCYNRAVNAELIRCCREKKIDIVFFYNCRIITVNTVKKLKALGIIVVTYSNDNPFSKAYPNYFWNKHLAVAKYADYVYAYRKTNIDDYRTLGCKNVGLLRSYYIDKQNYPVPQEMKLKMIPDVLFLGHVEQDGRIECINKLIEAGVSVGLQKNTRQFYIVGDNAVEMPNSHSDYNLLLSSCKIALVFLSTKNQDTYTRRCFEIPAAGTMMMSIYTDDLARMFEPDRDAVFFSNPDELLEKVQYYLKNKQLREKIANSGRERLLKDGHEIKSRAMQIIHDLSDIQQ